MLWKGGVVLTDENNKWIVTEWYDRYSDSVFSYIYVMVRDYQLAEDLTQDTFFRAYKKYHLFEKKAEPKTWLISIARNLTIDYIRKQKPINLLKELFQSNKNTDPTPQDMMLVRESTQELYKALDNLKPSYRDVIILRKLKGFSTKETGEVLNWSESKVKTTLHRAIPALEKQLTKEGFLNEKTI